MYYEFIESSWQYTAGQPTGCYDCNNYVHLPRQQMADMYYDRLSAVFCASRLYVEKGSKNNTR